MHLKGGPTPDEIMAIALQKLQLKRGDIMADIGCGTGKIAIRAAMQADHVFAIDRRPEAISYARDAIERAGLKNITLLLGEGTDILESIDHLDNAFVGGSRDLEIVLRLLAARVTGAIVVNAVLIETMERAVSCMRELGIFQELVSVQIARSKPLAGGTILEPAHPVFIIVGRSTR